MKAYFEKHIKAINGVLYALNCIFLVLLISACSA
jgi:hypothetical protein